MATMKWLLLPALALASTGAQASIPASDGTYTLAAGSPGSGCGGSFRLFDKVPGESTDQGHRDWSDVAGYVIGGSRSGTGPSSKVRFSASFGKTLDSASPALFALAASGGAAPGLVVETCRDSRLGSVCALRAAIEPGQIDGFSLGGALGKKDTVRMDDLLRIELTFPELSSSGAVINNHTFRWQR